MEFAAAAAAAADTAVNGDTNDATPTSHPGGCP